MGLLNRVSTFFGSKLNAALDAIEDPNATLDYSYEKMRDLLNETRRHLVDVTTAKKGLELQIASTRAKANSYEEEAKKALSMGREDLAQAALERKAELETTVASLVPQDTDMAAEVEKLTEAVKKLEAKLAAFRTQKEVTKAQYTAAKAEVKISESITGISSELGNVGESISHAKDKTDRMKARAGAIDQLLENGLLDNTLEPDATELDRDLAKAARQQAVSTDLERLKKEMGMG